MNDFKEALNKSFDRLRTNGKWLIPFVVSLSNHERNQLIQCFLNRSCDAPVTSAKMPLECCTA